MPSPLLPMASRQMPCCVPWVEEALAGPHGQQADAVLRSVGPVRVYGGSHVVFPDAVLNPSGCSPPNTYIIFIKMLIFVNIG